MSDTPTTDIAAGWWSAEGPDDPEERSRRLRASLEELRAIHARFRKERGGKLIPVDVIDRALDQIRGRADADLD